MADSSRLQEQFWSPKLQGEELRAAAFGFADGLWNSEGEVSRRDNFLTWASQYEGRPLTSLHDFESSVADVGSSKAIAVGKTTRNLTRTLIDTAMSRFAKSETRVQFVTNGGTPAEQRRSEEGTDAANALVEQTKSEAELRKAALHACVFDLGLVKEVDDDGPHPGPAVEHVHAWEVMFEPADAHRGKPSIWTHRQPVDREALIARFVVDEPTDTLEDRDAKEELRGKIRDSGSAGLIAPDHTQTNQHCIAYELWRAPIGKAPGRHVVVTDHALVFTEKWTKKTPPFVKFGWSAPLKGAYPTSVAAIVSELQFEIDGIRNRVSQIMRQMAIPTYDLEGTNTGSVASKIRVGSGAIGDILEHDVGTKLTRIGADGVRGHELPDEEDRAWAKGFEMTGISQSSAIGSRPAGLNSAPAQREWNEINQDRLSLVALDYQQAHVDLAELLLEAVAEMPDYEISIKDPNGKWLKKVKAASLGIADADYVIQRFPIGALPTTPTGKLAAAADLLQATAITPEQFQQIVQLPDLKGELDINLASRKATQKIVGRILETGTYEAPLDIMDLGGAIKYATAMALEAIAADAPESKWSPVLDFIAECKSKLEAKAAKAAAAAPAPSLAGTSIAPLTPAPLAPPPQAMAQGMAA